MTHPTEHLLAACLFAALCGCAAVQEPRHQISAPSPSTPPVTTPAAVPAEESVPPADEKMPAEALPRDAGDTPAAQTLDLLRQAGLYNGMPSEQQQWTLAEAETGYDIERTPSALLRYALLLSLSEPDRQTSADTADRLRDLLETRAGTEAAGDDMAALARLLLHVLDEREHLLAQNTQLQRKLDQLKAIEQQLGGRDSPDAAQIAP